MVVIGGGPAGLTAAYQLAKMGWPVTVLEADDIVGGISRTAQYKGFRFDIGGHRFFTKIAPVEALWHEILGTEFISVPRLSRIHYNGRFFDYPLKAGNALRGPRPDQRRPHLRSATSGGTTSPTRSKRTSSSG